MKILNQVTIENYKLEEVIKNPTQVYFYHVWFRGNFESSFFSKGKLPVDNEIIRIINQNPNLHLILMNEQEYETRTAVKQLDEIVKRLRLKPHRVWFVNNNEKLEEYKLESSAGINVHTSRCLISHVKRDENNALSFKTDKDISSFFLCHNRSPRPQRYALLCLLKKYGILESVDWSLVNGWGNDKVNFELNCLQLFTREQFQDLSSEAQYFESIEMKKSKYETNHFEFDNRNNQRIFFEHATYENSYFNIVTETIYHGEDIHITEKSFKPFYFLQFPLILASYQHGYYFRKAYPEYDFFDDVINHDYDNIEDDKERLLAFVNEVKRVNSNKEFFIEFYKNNEERFIKNHEVCKAYNYTRDHDFFKKLSELPVTGNKALNLVYDNWNEYTQYPSEPNCREVYTNHFMIVPDMSVFALGFGSDLIVRYLLEDMPKYPDRKFYYFITLIPNLFLSKIKDNKLPLPEEVLDYLLKYSNFNVVIINEQEFETFEAVEAIHQWSKALNINQKQLWISNNNIKLNDYKEILNSDINFYTTSWVKNHVGGVMHNKIGDIQYKPNKEGALFLCHNRRPRPHRHGLLCLLKKYGILDNVDWSLVNGWEVRSEDLGFYYNVFNEEDINSLSEEINYFQSIEQKKSRYEEEYTWFDDREHTNGVNWNETYVTATYENSYFNISTETEFRTEVIHISEKSFKAFYAMQFPLVLASPNHIAEMKKHFDYDWFDDVIDHSYDSVLSHRDRLYKFVEEVKRINDNKEFFIEFYKNNKQRFIDNHEKSLKWSSNPADKNFLLGLCDLPLIPWNK